MCLETFWRNNRGHLLFPHILHGNPQKLICALLSFAVDRRMD